MPLGGDVLLCLLLNSLRGAVGTEQGPGAVPLSLSPCKVMPPPLWSTPPAWIGAGFGAWRFGVALWKQWDPMEREQELGTVTLSCHCHWLCQAGLSSSPLSPNPYSLSFPVLPSSEKEQ